MNTTEVRTLALALMTEHGLLAQGWTLKFNRMLTHGGWTQPDTKIISLALPWLAANKDDEHEIRMLILHEIAHALVGIVNGDHHGPRWRAVCLSIGGDGKRTAETAAQPEGRYKSEPCACGKVFYKHRLPKNGLAGTRLCKTCRQTLVFKDTVTGKYFSTQGLVDLNSLTVIRRVEPDGKSKVVATRKPGSDWDTGWTSTDAMGY